MDEKNEGFSGQLWCACTEMITQYWYRLIWVVLERRGSETAF